MYSQVAPPESISERCSQNEVSSSTEEKIELKNKRSADLVEKPAHVSEEKWLKFQQLRERRQEECKPLPEKPHRKRQRRHVANDGSCSSKTVLKKSKGDILKDNAKAWKELCSNFDANSHLSQYNIAKQKPKSKLEEQLDEAIKEGNFSTAEKLSDEISKQEIGVKISNAIQMREYKKQKEEMEKWKKCKKKKKLLWGFEHKERWESKGNM